MESKDEFYKLQDELKEIIINNNLINFLSIAQECTEYELNLDDLSKMASTILNFK